MLGYCQFKSHWLCTLLELLIIIVYNNIAYSHESQLDACRLTALLRSSRHRLSSRSQRDLPRGASASFGTSRPPSNPYLGCDYVSLARANETSTPLYPLMATRSAVGIYRLHQFSVGRTWECLCRLSFVANWSLFIRTSSTGTLLYHSVHKQLRAPR